jgi:hypothetical protein
MLSGSLRGSMVDLQSGLVPPETSLGIWGSAGIFIALGYRENFRASWGR